MRAAAGLVVESASGQLVLDAYKDVRVHSRQGQVCIRCQVKGLFLFLKGIVSRDLECLQMILIKRLCVPDPDVPLEVYSFLKLHLPIVF